MISELTKIFKALSDDTRYRLIELLVTHDYCVGALAKQLDISESAVSQHLKALRQAGLVKGDKRGYFTHYYVNRTALKTAAEQIITIADLTQIGSGCCVSGSKIYSCQKCKGDI